jgi:hypothetical protein
LHWACAAGLGREALSCWPKQAIQNTKAKHIARVGFFIKISP